MMFELMKLPYEMDALEPFVSKETISFHHGKHHQGYVNKLNALIKDTEWEKESLDDIIKKSSGAIFNNAAQIWNHNFYWECLCALGKSPSSTFLSMINKTFGSLEQLQQSFQEKALSNFGSGWTWLVKNPDQSLEIINTSNAGNPLTENKTPLLTCDVWEHAYYIDYRNERKRYLENFWHIVNWFHVEGCYK